MLTRRRALARLALTGAAAMGVGLTAACSEDGGGHTDNGSGTGSGETLRITAIPDQDPDALTAREEAFAAHLAQVFGIEVEYVPVPDYAASVSLFGAGDLDLVFYGGPTGVQAQLQDPKAAVVTQRDINPVFTSVFIANTEADIEWWEITIRETVVVGVVGAGGLGRVLESQRGSFDYSGMLTVVLALLMLSLLVDLAGASARRAWR